MKEAINRILNNNESERSMGNISHISLQRYMKKNRNPGVEGPIGLSESVTVAAVFDRDQTLKLVYLKYASKINRTNGAIFFEKSSRGKG